MKRRLKTIGLLLAGLVLLLLAACGAASTATWQQQFDLGMKYITEGNYQEAIMAFTAAIEIDPKNVQLYLGRAEAYTALEQYEPALEDYDTVLAEEEAEKEILVDAYVGRAGIYVILERYEDALADYSIAIELLQQEERLAEKDAAKLQQCLMKYAELLSLLTNGEGNGTWSWVIEPEYEFDSVGMAYSMASTSEDDKDFVANTGLYIVQNNGQFGLMDLNGNWYFDQSYYAIEPRFATRGVMLPNGDFGTEESFNGYIAVREGSVDSVEEKGGVWEHRCHKKYFPDGWFVFGDNWSLQEDDWSLFEDTWDYPDEEAWLYEDGWYIWEYHECLWDENRKLFIHPAVDDYTFTEERSITGTMGVAKAYFYYLGEYLSVDILPDSKYAIATNDRLVSDFIYEDTGAYSGGLIAVKQNGKWGYADAGGKIIIPCNYEASHPLNFFVPRDSMRNHGILPAECTDGYVVLYDGANYALYSDKGEEVIPFGTFENISEVHDGMLWAKQDRKWGVLALNS